MLRSHKDESGRSGYWQQAASSKSLDLAQKMHRAESRPNHAAIASVPELIHRS